MIRAFSGAAGSPVGGGTRAIMASRMSRTPAPVLALEPSAVFVVPPVQAYEAGFPSARARGEQARRVRDKLEGRGWRGRVLALASAGEVERRATWPVGVDGVVCRPVGNFR